MANGMIFLSLGLYWLGCASVYMKYDTFAFWFHIIFASVSLILWWLTETFVKTK